MTKRPKLGINHRLHNNKNSVNVYVRVSYKGKSTNFTSPTIDMLGIADTLIYGLRQSRADSKGNYDIRKDPEKRLEKIYESDILLFKNVREIYDSLFSDYSIDLFNRFSSKFTNLIVDPSYNLNHYIRQRVFQWCVENNEKELGKLIKVINNWVYQKDPKGLTLTTNQPFKTLIAFLDSVNFHKCKSLKSEVMDDFFTLQSSIIEWESRNYIDDFSKEQIIYPHSANFILDNSINEVTAVSNYKAYLLDLIDDLL